MYERNLWKIMEAYEHIDEYPCNVTDNVRVYDIEWDEDDVEETPELSDVSSDELTVTYIQECPEDHSNRDEAIQKELENFYGCRPMSFEVELLDCLGSEKITESFMQTNRESIEEGLANALYSSDKNELYDSMIQLLNCISELDTDTFRKIRTNFYIQSKNSGLKNAIIKAMNFLLGK